MGDQSSSMPWSCTMPTCGPTFRQWQKEESFCENHHDDRGSAWKRQITSGSEASIQTECPSGAWELGAAASEEQLMQAVEDAIMGCGKPVSVSDPREHGGFMMVSTEFEEMFGYARHELLGKDGRLLFSGLQEPMCQVELQLAEKTGQPTSAYRVLRRKTGELVGELVHQQGLRLGLESHAGPRFFLIVCVHLDLNEDDADADSGQLDAHGLAQLAESVECVHARIQDSVRHML
eukprot:gb/GFBE01043790.1/.p1 GENE.gb/GFBE01043790.1/~~gb/GFBE01043790.1/.p1  ORF type:complete len:234 (+),score=48.63 gb/GFBE01043790.1/:1-702(+)